MTTTLPDSLQVALPPQWTILPLETADFDRFVAERVAEVADAMQRSEVRQLELLLHRLRSVVVSQRVSLVGTYIAFDDRDGDDPVTIMATCAATTLERTALGTDVPLHEDVLLTAFANTAVEGEESREVEPPKKMILNGCPAVRLIRLSQLRDETRRSLKLLVQTYLVPVAEGDGVIVLNFSTINFEYAKQFSELFEKIAGTLRILYPDDPTFEDDVSVDPGQPEDVGR